MRHGGAGGCQTPCGESKSRGSIRPPLGHGMSDNPILVSLPIAAISFGLKFEHVDDRYAHCVFARSPEWDEDRVLLSSVEGDALSDWPSSPPVQDLLCQEIDGRPVVMTVGMAGGSHWSAACGLTQTDDAVVLDFDMACRVSQHPDWLGSTYQWGPLADPKESGTDRFQIALGSRFELRIIQVETEGYAGRCQFESPCIRVEVPVERAMELSLGSGSPSSPTRTLRWRYQLEIRQTEG